MSVIKHISKLQQINSRRLDRILQSISEMQQTINKLNGNLQEEKSRVTGLIEAYKNYKRNAYSNALVNRIVSQSDLRLFKSELEKMEVEIVSSQEKQRGIMDEIQAKMKEVELLNAEARKFNIKLEKYNLMRELV